MSRFVLPVLPLVAAATALPASAAPGDITEMLLVGRSAGQCAAVVSAGTTPGTPVTQWTCWGTAGQVFDARVASGGYTIVDRNGELCLAVKGGPKTTGAAVTVETCAGTKDQVWAPIGRGGDDVSLKNAASGLCLAVGATGRQDGDPLVQLPCEATPAQTFVTAPRKGTSSWSGILPTPMPAVASTVLPNGKVLLWSARNRFKFGYGEIGRTYTAVFDPVTGKAGERVVSNTNHEMFCPGIATLADGRVLVNGGSSSFATSLYDPKTNAWSKGAAMNVPRGYQADTVLGSGDVFTLGGSWSGDLGHRMGEVWNAASGWRLLSKVDGDVFAGNDPGGIFRADNHMWLFGWGTKDVFHAGPAAAMHWIDTTGDGAVKPAGKRGADPYSINGSVVMYDAYRLLKAGGAPGYESGDGTTAAYTIDFSGGPTKPVRVARQKPMLFPRAFSNAVVLPSGEVVVIGGRFSASTSSDANAIMVPELWSPATKTFTRLEAMYVPRHYHSSAVLLTDGRIFVGGGGVCGTCVDHPDAQILTPPYLFAADGSPAVRPLVTKAPTAALRGATLKVTTDRAVAKFALVRMGAATHTVNNDQRRVPLKIAAKSGTSYTLTVPADPGLMVGGNWLLFALDAKGVPSVGKVVRIR